MATISATDAKNRIGDLWALAEDEPVTIEKNGVAKFQLISTEHYVAVPLAEYNRMKTARRTPQFGFARRYFKGYESDALMAADANAEIEQGL